MACGSCRRWTVLTAPVDDDGIVPEDWEAKLLFVTPTRQFPSGAVLSASRRLKLLDWASRRDAIIVEDDYDSELRWNGRPVEPLKALDRDHRVVYIGTFSKTMFVNLRIGYVVLPQSLVEIFRRAKSLTKPQPSGMAEQRALAHFMMSGGYAGHLRRLRRNCGRRLIHFREEMRRLERWFRFVPADAGLHMYAQWRGAAEEYAIFKAACEADGSAGPMVIGSGLESQSSIRRCLGLLIWTRRRYKLAWISWKLLLCDCSAFK